MTGFSAADCAVLLLYLVGITVFGTLFRRSQRTVKDYFLGAKNISWIVISLSIVATETSTLTLIGVPALAYSTFARREQGGNLTYLQIVSGYIIARILISVLLILAYFQGELMTAYELLKRRTLACANLKFCVRPRQVDIVRFHDTADPRRSILFYLHSLCSVRRGAF